MNTITPDETVLGLLTVCPQHGYQLLACFRDPAQLGEVWNMSTSQLYAVLKRLAQQGFITGHEMESVDAPVRVEYTLTAAGYARVHAWLHEENPSASVRRVRVEFLSRLFIARLLNIPTAQIVQNQKRACRERLAALTAQRELLPPGIGFLAFEFMIAQLDAILAWIDRCELVPKGLDEEDA